MINLWLNLFHVVKPRVKEKSPFLQAPKKINLPQTDVAIATVVVFGCNYQKKNDQRKISSDSVKVLSRPSEKPQFSLIELALFEKMDLEVSLIKSVHRDSRFSIFLVFAKNEALKGLLGTSLPYNQLMTYILAPLCAIFIHLASKLWRSQWFGVGQLAVAN